MTTQSNPTDALCPVHKRIDELGTLERKELT